MTGNIFTIAPNVSFVDSLAKGVFARFGDTPEKLSSIKILLPNRRSCRALAEAFSRAANGKALLLPQMHGIGDVEEDEIGISLAFANNEVPALEPAISITRRRLLLAELIRKWSAVQDKGAPNNNIQPDQAVNLATELGQLLDEMQRQHISFENLKSIVPDDLAKHWDITLEFLKILGEQWPLILKEERKLDTVARRNRLLEAQARVWKENPPHTPVIAAGSTGSMPATQKLLKTIAEMGQGMIVLPGLDVAMEESEWKELPENHPQHAMQQLLKVCNISRQQVVQWEEVGASERVTLLKEAMRPSATSHKWQQVKLSEKAVVGLKLIEAPSEHGEALTVAMLLRGVLEEKKKTASLVTNNRSLARRVSSLMQRWGVEVNDSAGQTLSETPSIIFLRLVAQLITARFAPAPFLSCLKHPLASGGEETASFRKKVRELELLCLRGVRMESNLAALRDEVAEDAVFSSWLDGLIEMLKPLEDILVEAKPMPFSEIFEKHLACAEKLAASKEESATQRLWIGEAGDAAAKFMEEVRDSYEGFEILPEQYAALFEALLSGKSHRPRFGTHPRISILSPMEARLQHCDLLILGGLNQGSWPMEHVNPWMSKGMAKDCQLPGQERAQALSAHDFYMFACAPQVVITRAEKDEGAPTVPSSFLLRLKAVLQGCGLLKNIEEKTILSWADAIQQPAAENVITINPPAPNPPLEARPSKLPVTQIEKLMRDPYAVYARRVLHLKPLKPIDQDPGAADFGSLIHEALEGFIKGKGYALKKEEAEKLIYKCGREAFAPLKHKPSAYALWWPRFEEVAAWFVGNEISRFNSKRQIFAEVEGEWKISFGTKSFTLTAKADRIEVEGDALSVIDYKTGSPPGIGEVKQGYAPQLVLEALIGLEGGFEGIPYVKEVKLLSYWRTNTGKDLGAEKDIKGKELEVLDVGKNGFLQLLSFFDGEEAVYLACPNPAKAPREEYNDFVHLERLKEWL